MFCDGRRHDAGRGRDALELARTADDDLVEDAVVGAGEHRDGAAAGDGARDAHRAHHRLGAGVAERGAVGAGDLAEQLGGLAGEHVLRPDLVAERRPARGPPRARSPAASRTCSCRSRGSTSMYSLPSRSHSARAARALDHDLVGQLLGERAEAVDHPRIGHVAAVRAGVLLRAPRALRVPRDERVEPARCCGVSSSTAVWIRAIAPNAFLTSYVCGPAAGSSSFLAADLLAGPADAATGAGVATGAGAAIGAAAATAGGAAITGRATCGATAPPTAARAAPHHRIC